MTRDKRKRRRRGGSPTPAVPAQSVLDEAAGIVAEIEAVGAAEAGPRWGAVHKLLLRTDVDPGHAARLIATRDVAGLARAVEALRSGTVPSAEPPPAAPAAEAPPVPPEIQKKAMRAFRKRLKLTRLDHESRLGVGPMTGGRTADFDAILPPRDFPAEVWTALVADGKLVAAGNGFYMLAEDAARS